jgi:ribonucleoside-diphosphate reductase alpha chain
MSVMVSTALLQTDEQGDFTRPKILDGKTLRLKLPQGSLYITLNSGDKPMEVFVELGKSGADFKADSEALGRLISLYLQTGGNVKNVIKSLKGIKGSQAAWGNGPMHIYSIPDAIAKGLEVLTDGVTPAVSTVEAQLIVNPEPEPLIKGIDFPNGKIQDNAIEDVISYTICPDCHEEAVVQDGGCCRCTACGYSKCG